jgi:hypothetical protein
LVTWRVGDLVKAGNAPELANSPDRQPANYFLPFFGFSTWATLIRFALIALRMIT